MVMKMGATRSLSRYDEEAYCALQSSKPRGASISHFPCLKSPFPSALEMANVDLDQHAIRRMPQQN